MTNILEKKQKQSDVVMQREHFPILKQYVNQKPLIYFDNAATMHKPDSVLAVMEDYYQHDNANIHRGVHTLSVRATAAYENSRQLVRQFVNAKHNHEIIFVSGTTEGINLVAQCFGRLHLQAGDEIVISEMEHHSNIVPWQLVCEQTGAILKVISVTDNGELDLESYVNLITEKTKIIALAHVSNAIGTINPIEKMIAIAHQFNIPVLIDGAQAAPHMMVDVQKLDCDFYVFSSHKMYGPTGVGVLYGKEQWLEKLPPYQGGGDMITEVSFTKTTYAKLPNKFEAGTPNIAGVIGLGAAISFLNSVGLNKIADYENELLDYATDVFSAIEGFNIIGTAAKKAAIVSFTFDDIHPHDIGTVLDHDGIAIRAGHHCAMPLMARFNVPATARISLSFYNTQQEIDICAEALVKLKKLFGC